MSQTTTICESDYSPKCDYTPENKTFCQRCISLDDSQHVRRSGPGFEQIQGPNDQSYPRQHSLLNPVLIELCVREYFTHVHRIQPFLSPSVIAQLVERVGRSNEAHAVIGSLCAYVLLRSSWAEHISTTHQVDKQQPSRELGKAILNEVLCIHRVRQSLSEATPWTITTSYLIFCSWSCLRCPDQAWYYLREATTLVHMLGLHQEPGYHDHRLDDPMRARLLFWVLFIAERTFALQHRRPITLQPVVNLPGDGNKRLGYSELNGLMDKIRLFTLIDDGFVSRWNDDRKECSRKWVEDFQCQMTLLLPTIVNCPGPQNLDLISSLHWLKAMTWRLSASRGQSSYGNEHDVTSFQFLLRVSRDLMSHLWRFDLASLRAYSQDISSRLHDVISTIDMGSSQTSRADPLTRETSADMTMLMNRIASPSLPTAS